MYSYVKQQIKAQDNFGFSPSIRFNVKQKFNTIPGGLFSMFFSLFTLWLWYHNFEMMFRYQDQYISSFVSETNLTEVGKVYLNDMGVMPFI